MNETTFKSIKDIPKMTASKLRQAIETNSQSEQYFFSRATMKFFGDTMANYGCRVREIINSESEYVFAYELYRRRPVKNGLSSSAFFDCKTFSRIFPRKDAE